MSTPRKNGFALPAAIGGLVIAGVLVTAGFYMARQEVRIGVASENSTLAMTIAQSAINDVLVNETSQMTSLAVWDSVTVHDTVSHGMSAVKVYRVDDRLFMLDATATVTKGGSQWAGATRRVGLVTRMTTAQIDPPAALTSQGALQWGGSSQVHGMDGAPDASSGNADWTGTGLCGAPTDKPGLLTNDTSNIQWSGNRDRIEDSSSGSPLMDQDTTITAQSLTEFGDMGWDDITALRDIYRPDDPGTVEPSFRTDGACQIGDIDNWGDPLDPSSTCFNYFPIIHIDNPTSEVTLNSGYGQGILLVEGDLRVNGGFEFYGPVFIRGTLTTNGSGGHFWGGVVAANVNLDTNTVLGNAVINYSSCAIERALLNNSALTKVRPVAMRSWVDLSSVGS